MSTRMVTNMGSRTRRLLGFEVVHYNWFHLLDFAASKSMSTSTRRTQQQRKTNALVVGSSGALGSSMAQHLLRMKNVNVIGADVQDSSETVQLSAFIPLPHPGQLPTLGEVTQRLSMGVNDALMMNDQQNFSDHDDDDDDDDDDEGEENRMSGEWLDLIVVAAGGWEGDPVLPVPETDDGALQYGDVVDRMIRQNLYPAMASGYVAQYFMNKGGLFVAFGATPALDVTPGMMGYGVAKSATHSFVRTFGSMTGRSLNSKLKRKQSSKLRQNFECLDDMTVVGVLPTMLDTAANRRAEPKGNFETWTKPSDIAKEICDWMENPYLRPHSGSLIKVSTIADETFFQLSR